MLYLIQCNAVKASLTYLRYSAIRMDLIHTFYPNNGGNSGSGYSDPKIVSPYNSEAHSVLACIQDSQHRLFSVSQYQRLLALFTVFKFAINEIIRQENLLSSSLADLRSKYRTSRGNTLTLSLSQWERGLI